jgi:DNA polymerase IV
MSLEFPNFYLLRIGFENKTAALHDLEREIGPALAYNNKETNLFVGKVSRAKRAVLELKGIDVLTENVVRAKGEGKVKEVEESPRKRRKVDKKGEGKEDGYIWIDSDTASENETDGDVVVVEKGKGKGRERRGEMGKRASSPATVDNKEGGDGGDMVKVLKLDWYTDSVKAGKVLPMEEYVVYEGRRIEKAAPKPQPTKLLSASVMTRARAESPPPASISTRHKRGPPHSHSQSQHSQPKPHLLHQTTSGLEEASNLPPLPDYCTKQYSCQRPTPSPSPNGAFIAQLKKILLARKLMSDSVGERAYNAAIASIAAYPYTLTNVEEILRLPHCGKKYAALYQEWKDTGHIREVDDFENDPKMQSLAIFYQIHDVAGKTANQFYDRGWRDLDDVIEFGWKMLDENQQVGVKFYDDFQAKIPREEVERIGQTVLDYANGIREGFQMVICGGYRRGKKLCGDVDIILTHPDESATHRLIDPLREELENGGWILYTLQTSNRNSSRNQEPLNWKGSMPRARAGFDSLDKALVVWQDPNWPTEEEDLERDPKAKNPNRHRRVDIIISPWKTAGCAIVGWSGATMFERDIRLYCRTELGCKFDSSGVRTLKSGDWVDLEGKETDLLVKEKKVFEGLGLEWREPTLRCTDG